MPILGFINTVLRSYALSLPILYILVLTRPYPRSAAPPQKFGALNMTAALGPWMMRHPDVKNNMEAFVMQFVTPEFGAQEAYLRAIVSRLYVK